MPKLSQTEIDAFLAERNHLARIATVRADGTPTVVPVWFIYEHGHVLITPRKHSAFLTNIRCQPRVAITIDEDTGLYRKVLVEGTANILHEVGEDRKWNDVYRRIACRYVDEAAADFYLSETHDQPRALIGVNYAAASITTLSGIHQWLFTEHGAYAWFLHNDAYHPATSPLVETYGGVK